MRITSLIRTTGSILSSRCRRQLPELDIWRRFLWRNDSQRTLSSGACSVPQPMWYGSTGSDCTTPMMRRPICPPVGSRPKKKGIFCRWAEPWPSVWKRRVSRCCTGIPATLHRRLIYQRSRRTATELTQQKVDAFRYPQDSPPAHVYAHRLAGEDLTKILLVIGAGNPMMSLNENSPWP